MPVAGVDLGGMDLRDVIFLGMFSLLFLQGLIRKQLVLPFWPSSGVWRAFMGLAVFSTPYALLYHNVAPNWAFAELRPVAFYGVFFVAAWAIRRPQQLVTVLVGLFVLADLTGAIIILQQFLGLDHYLLAAMENNWNIWRAGDSAGEFGTVRVIPPGHVLMFIMMLFAFVLLVYQRLSLRLRIVLALQFVYLNFSLLFTYTRAQWIAAVIAITIIVLLLSSAERSLLARYVLICLAIGLLVFAAFGTQIQVYLNNITFISALSERVYSIFTPEETLSSHSLQWRVFETEEALHSIS